MSTVRTGDGCQADRDDYCVWRDCPQLRDGEPAKSGRHCPLDKDHEEGPDALDRLTAAESRAQAAEARAAMLERELDKIANMPRGDFVLHGPRLPAAIARAALTASPSPLAQAIEGVLEAWRTECLHAEWQAALDALRAAWRGAEPRETT